MTADQVIVYKQGNSLDKAILSYTLLKHNNIDAHIVIKDNKAAVVTGS